MTRMLPLVLAAVTALWSSFAPAPSYVATCNGGAGAGDSFFNAGLTCGESFTNGEPEPSHSGLSPVSTQPTFQYRNPCADVGIGNAVTGAPTCPQNTCPAGQQMYQLWLLTPPPAGPRGLVCSGNGPPGIVAPPQVTDPMVLAAFRRIPLPSLRSHSQPADKTLINFDTIFFTEAEPLTRQVTLLGQNVRLEITPSRFEWVHGDGTTDTTATPGAPYPAKDIVHRYADAHRTVAHRVVVTWSAEWSLNGGPLQPVNGTVTTTGPATPLRIAEASPALSGSGH
jgi:hypothetical protein